MIRASLATSAALLAAAAAALALAAEPDPPGAPPDKALLEVDEATAFLPTPADEAQPLARFEPGEKLVLVTHKKHGRYFRVVRIGRGPVGWVDSGAVTFLRDKDEQDEPEEGERCADSLDACPDHGCAKAGDPVAVANRRKRTPPEGDAAVALGFEDYARLQELADERVGQGPPELDEAGRARLAALPLGSGRVAEGALVRTFGYIAKGNEGLHVNAHGESVNCNLKGKSDNDFHIPLVGRADDTEFQGIVVEMIPQRRPGNWRIEALEKVRDEGREVWVEGALYYDKEHFVSADPDNVLKNDPNRAALWEIHPVTKFLVCRKEHCARDREQDWEQL